MDITKCSSKTCPIKGSCRRHTAHDSEFQQSWDDFSSSIKAGINGYTCEKMIHAWQIVESYKTDQPH